MNASRWLNWKPTERISQELAWSEPSKPTEPAVDEIEDPVSREESEERPLEESLKGAAVELYLADGDRLFIVADEEDALKVSEPRGTIYTAAEVRCIVKLADPNVVAEVQRWKRKFNATLRASKRSRDSRS
jgi:hypothetical protein